MDQGYQKGAGINFGAPYAIFDMDGTLIDSNHMVSAITEEYLSRHRCTPGDGFYNEVLPMSLEEYCVALQELTEDHPPVDEIMREIFCSMRGFYRSVKEMSRVREYMELLRNEGIRMAVASATEKELVLEVLSRLRLTEYFDCILSTEEVGKGKKHPDVYYAAAKRLGTDDVSSVVVYEDSIVAQRTAKQAGFKVCGIYDQYSLDDPLESKMICDAFIEGYDELLPSEENAEAK